MAITDGIVECWSPSVRGSGYLLPGLKSGNHGTLTNMAGNDWVGASVRGVSGTVLDYDGSDDRVELLTAKAAILGLPAISVVSWVYPTALGVDGKAVVSIPISNTADTSPFQVLDLSWSSTGFIRGNVGDGLTRVFYTATDVQLSVNAWSCIAMLWTGATITTARNGIISSGSSAASYTGIGVSAATTGAMRIGSYRNESQYAVAGMIGETTIYRRALTASEFADIYRRGNGAIGRELTGQTRRRVYGFVPAGFKAYWVRQKSQIIGGGV